MRPHLLVPTLLASALALSASCRQVLGIEEREPGPGGCPNVFVTAVREECRVCLRAECCAELAACNADPACLVCTEDEGGCTKPDSFDALAACVVSCGTACDPDPLHILEPKTPLYCKGVPFGGQPKGECASVDLGYRRVRCNPVTNAECSSEDVCDLDEHGVFGCRSIGHHFGLCHTCGLEGLCGATLVCAAGQCARWCCADADCDDGKGSCEEMAVPGLPGLGVCVEKAQ